MIDLRAWWRISRPKHIPICSGGACLSLLVLGSKDPVHYAVAAPVAALMVTGAIIHNDYLDRDVDAIAKPYRPIPSGRIEPDHANFVGTLMMVAGVILSTLLGFLPALIALGLYGLSYYYNAKAKKDHAFVGNLVVAICVAATLYFPMTITGNYNLWPQALAFLLVEWYRETFITCQDTDGDMQAGLKTLPVLIGIPRALFIAFLMMAFSTPIFFITLNDNLGWVYRFTVMAFLACLYFGWYKAAVIEMDPYRKYDKKEEDMLFDRYQLWGRRIAKNLLVLMIVMMLIDVMI